MNTYIHTLTSILVIACVILLVVVLQKRGVLRQESGILFSQLVIQITLLALIFDALSKSTFEWQYILLFLYMFLSEMILLVIAWIFGKILKLEQRSQMGSFLLALKSHIVFSSGTLSPSESPKKSIKESLSLIWNSVCSSERL